MIHCKPVQDILIIKQADNERVTDGGIVIPDLVERPDMGEVVAAGPGRLVGGERRPMYSKVGDRVLFSKHMVQDVRIDGQDYKTVLERHLFAIV
jgi:chaperonin GroES